MAGLSFDDVHKDYGDVHALRGLDLEVGDGELMVLAGPSGCGKTTALRIAAGLDRPTRGTISIRDRDVTRLPPVDRNVSMVFQSYALFPHLNVADNIGFGLVARKVPRGDIGDRVREAADLVGCGDLLARRPSELSGGERQRVALARALVRHPDAFLLDEPLSNLDAQLRVHMRAELKLLHQRVAATMLYVTHDQVEALTLGDRLAVLRAGALQQVGTPDDVYRRPANRFVATFVGSPQMNILPATIDGAGLRAGPFTASLPRVREISGQRRLELGIRPEHVGVMTHGDGVPLTVEIVEPAGNQTYLYLSAGNDSLVAAVGADLRPPVGSTVRVVLDERWAYVFDADSGTTLVCPS